MGVVAEDQVDEGGSRDVREMLNAFVHVAAKDISMATGVGEGGDDKRGGELNGDYGAVVRRWRREWGDGVGGAKMNETGGGRSAVKVVVK